MRQKYFFFWVCFFISLVPIIQIGRRLYTAFYLYPIDLVYLWVDGSDEQWAEKKLDWQQKLNVSHSYSVSESRFTDREELLHSLRSVEMYLPWVRKIYIVTDNQIPKWLNTNHPKIKMVFHQDIFPPDALPVFNSMAIETRLPYISGLSEHFIYANDDIFVNKPLSPDFFFDSDGRPIVYSDEVQTEINKVYYENESDLWRAIADKPYNLIKSKTDKNISFLKQISDTHTLSSYKKSDFLQVLKLFETEFHQTTYSKFRSATDLNRGIIDMWNILQHKVAVKNARRMPEKYGCSISGFFVMNDMSRLEQEDPCLFCLNDAVGVSAQLHTNYLRRRFSKKSAFEK